MPKCKIARFNMKLNQIYFINLLNNINDITSFIHQYKAINQPLGSMPLDANSLRKILLIQAETEASPSISNAFLTAFSKSGSILNAICLLPLGKIISFVFDTCCTSLYYLSCVIHCKTRDLNNQASDVLPAQTEALTNNLTKDKTMANLNYTGFTYIFIGILRTDLSNRLHKLRIPAESELQARKKLARDYVLVFAGKIPVKTEEGLSIVGNRCSIQGTTSVDANRKRYSSGIFLSQIPFKSRLSKFGLVSFIEFAVRLINRNKASNRTNKVSRSIAVVETVSHPTKGGTHILTKQLRNPTMKTSQKSTVLLAVRSRTPIVFTPAMEVNHA
ncbi:host cell division inhibitor Icd-like protein [Pasteurella multocida]|uniref:host cell division inhibitor Icd-like protein n=1 Tax=Pasteurella multocida TaxID=747 RepID=UPI0020201762|nr:host cell division inhibitor Icd-like protein [Pasteurella multocida]MCL7820933.1 host cell division inhibitor Icd-like protein [Pasteurella multocida]